MKVQKQKHQETCVKKESVSTRSGTAALSRIENISLYAEKTDQSNLASGVCVIIALG